jgi:hypothetical protein
MTGRGDAVRRRMLQILAGQPLFAGLDGAALSALAAQMEWFALGGGRMLFDQDEVADGLFLLVYGRLGAIRRDPDGRVRDLGTISPGECVGETGLLADAPRYARIVALRDCELLFLPKAGFERLAALHPQAMLKLVQLVLRRFYATRSRNPPPNCFALLPAGRGVDVEGFGRRLAAALGGFETLELITPGVGGDKPSGWFAEREAAMRHLVYVGNDDPVWRERCARQSAACCCWSMPAARRSSASASRCRRAAATCRCTSCCCRRVNHAPAAPERGANGCRRRWAITMYATRPTWRGWCGA